MKYKEHYKKRFFAALLCLGLLAGLVPGMGTTAFAASSYSVGDTVEFAGYEWYVIGTETEGVTAPSGCYTLFAKNNDFGDSVFGSSINYKDSDLHSAVEQIASGFSESDKNNIVARETLDGISGESPTNQLLWPLSNDEANSLDSSMQDFTSDYYTRTGENRQVSSDYWMNIVYYYRCSSKSITASVTYTSSSTAVRPALYVKAEAVEEDDIPYFTQQPQTQYAVEGGSITFTAKAEVAGTEITESNQYTWQVQAKDGSDDTWYEVKQLIGAFPVYYPMTYYGQTLTISNVSGTWWDNGYYMNVDFQPKDALFRCVAIDDNTNVSGYSDTAEIVVVAAGTGQDGEDGREVELQNNGTYIQWRYAGEDDTAWRDLVALDAITGSDGADGREVQFQVADGYIQWKYDTDSDWQNLIALSDLMGADGDTPYIGDNGNWWIGGADTGIPATGSDGADGSDGKDGLTPYIGSNGNWWIGTTDTGVKAAGSNGADGSDGKDGSDGADGQDGLTPYIGSNGNWWIGTTDTGIKAAGTDGADGKNGADGQDGSDGVGIADIQLNENGELIVTLTDGTEKNLGKVTGEDGVGISGVSINEKGELIVTLTDGTELNAGAVPTAAAETSELKTIVYVSMGTAGVSLAGMLGLLAFLLTKRKMLIGK